MTLTSRSTLIISMMASVNWIFEVFYGVTPAGNKNRWYTSSNSIGAVLLPYMLQMGYAFDIS